jgi:hypothetical protein
MNVSLIYHRLNFVIPTNQLVRPGKEGLKCHIEQSLYAWHFVASWNQVKRYQEIHLCDQVLKEWRNIAYRIILAILLEGVLHTNRKCFGFAICKKLQVRLTDVRFFTYAAFGPNVLINAYFNVSLVTETTLRRSAWSFVAVSATY